MSDNATARSPAEDLAYIRHIMEDTRRAVALRGTPFIIWGFLVLLGLLGDYLLSLYRIPGPYFGALWGGLTLIGWLSTWLSLRHSLRNTRVRSEGGRLVGWLWVACGIATIVIVFAGVYLGAVAPMSILGIVAGLLGIGIFLTGVLMGARWVRNIAFGWWAGAVAEFYWHGVAQLLIFAILIAAFYIVPGLVLNYQARGNTVRQ